jgi:gas vesicle protein
MADGAQGHDRFENESNGGGSFMMGLLTGTVLGAGLGMLFAPKAGSELRSQVREQAGNLASTASDGYRRASETASELAGRGREVAADVAGRGREIYDKARDAVSRGVEEGQRHVRDAASELSAAASRPSGSGSTGSSGPGAGSSFGSPESMRGSGSGGPFRS